ncbi:MAG: alkane 1-monooxygenase [Verrucomicrobia bacterium]|nr:alkane 1-monooxygenase [Cytophagales bacterium]
MTLATQKITLWQELSALKYLLSLVPAGLAIAGNLSGGYFSLLNVIFPLVILVGLDWLVPVNHKSVENLPDRIPNLILYLSVVFHTVAVFSLIYGIYAGILQNAWVWYAALGTGFSSGILGITAAHELIHRKQKHFQWLGIWNLFLSNYTHFYIEHRLGHHFKVATQDDPASARYGESFYRFIFRGVPAQWLGGLTLEANRLRKAGKMPFTLNNFVLTASLLQLIFMVSLYFLLGSEAMWAYLMQTVIGFLLLEYVNYIEHYGLIRDKGEKVEAHHAWQSDTISSRFTLLELSRHSDHHLKAFKPYHTLDSHEESPVMPSGYFGMFYIGLIPPLWFAVVHPILDKFRKEEVDSQ